MPPILPGEPLEGNLANLLSEWVEPTGIEPVATYPVAIDTDYRIWEAFNNLYWPALYFVDAKGTGTKGSSFPGLTQRR